MFSSIDSKEKTPTEREIAEQIKKVVEGVEFPN